jgi:hypothetical protein
MRRRSGTLNFARLQPIPFALVGTIRNRASMRQA